MQRAAWVLLGAVAVLAADIAIGQANHWADSGSHDPPGQIAVFWIFLASVLTIVVSAIVLVVRRLRRQPKPGQTP